MHQVTHRHIISKSQIVVVYAPKKEHRAAKWKSETSNSMVCNEYSLVPSTVSVALDLAAFSLSAVTRKPSTKVDGKQESLRKH